MSEVGRHITLHIGRVLNPKDLGQWDDFFPGFLAVDGDGRVVRCGEWNQDARNRFGDSGVLDHGGCVISPGFVDAHLHLPQLDARGMAGATLLEWLERYIYPAEMAFADPSRARETTRRLLKELVANGITTAAIYSSVHTDATQIAFEEASAFGYRAVIGKVLMDSNAPSELLQEPERAIEESVALCERWHGYQGRLFYAFTPRFAPACSFRLMQMAAEAGKGLGAYVQTHLSENRDEVELVKRLFPQYSSYTQVYLKTGVLGEKTIVGHAVHLSDQERAVLRESGTKVAHCPSSNLFLHSGCMDLPAMERCGIAVALGSDIGAGPTLSPFEVMRNAYYCNMVSPAKLFYYATKAGAQVLGMEERIGSFEAGKEADFVVLDPGPLATELPLEQLLSQLVFRGDRSTVVATFVRGVCLYHRRRD